MSTCSDIVVAGLGGRVLALSTSDGAVKWEHDVELHRELSVLVQEDLVLATAGSRLVGIGLRDGVKKFDVDVPGSVVEVPTLTLKGSRLLIAGAGEIVCFELDGRLPRLVWHNRLPGRGIGPVSLA